MCKRVSFLLLFALTLFHPRVYADQLCDPAYQNCRVPLINLIQNETVGIDVAFWFMEDARYTYALINKFKQGVPVRVLVDPRANTSDPLNADRLAELAAAGIPMRKCIAPGILHWKTMIFAGQRVVEFSGANYSSEAFVYITPYTNYVDEAIFFTSTAAVVDSFETKFDNSWTNTTSFSNYANINAPPVRNYPTYTISPSLNFPPGSGQDYALRSVTSYNAETTGIDAIVYRITDRRHTDALINAIGRGVKVRIYTEQDEYRDPNRLWDSWNVDRLYMAGAQIRLRAHSGLNHQKLVILRGQQQIIFGSSNWSTASANSQQEHNYWTQTPWIYSWMVNQFERKWGNLAGYAETKPFVPLPPDKPAYVSPAQGARLLTPVTLKWKPGPWAHLADVYLGTSTTPPKIMSNIAVTPNATMSITISNLQPGETYYWKIVDKTMAYKTASGPVWYFGT